MSEPQNEAAESSADYGTDEATNASSESTTGAAGAGNDVTDDMLPDDLRPTEDNPLAQPAEDPQADSSLTPSASRDGSDDRGGEGEDGEGTQDSAS
jgi:hypothetical protein